MWVSCALALPALNTRRFRQFVSVYLNGTLTLGVSGRWLFADARMIDAANLGARVDTTSLLGSRRHGNRSQCATLRAFFVLLPFRLDVLAPELEPVQGDAAAHWTKVRLHDSRTGNLASPAAFRVHCRVLKRNVPVAQCALKQMNRIGGCPAIAASRRGGHELALRSASTNRNISSSPRPRTKRAARPTPARGGLVMLAHRHASDSDVVAPVSPGEVCREAAPSTGACGRALFDAGWTPVIGLSLLSARVRGARWDVRRGPRRCVFVAHQLLLVAVNARNHCGESRNKRVAVRCGRYEAHPLT